MAMGVDKAILAGIALLIFVVVSIFALLNLTPVSIFYFFGAKSFPVSFLILTAFLLGLLIGGIMGYIAGIFDKKEKV